MAKNLHRNNYGFQFLLRSRNYQGIVISPVMTSAVVLFILFVGRPWPVALGTGIGFGYAASNCQHDFRRLDSVYCRAVEVNKELCK